ncbi:MAG: hypothetical protein WC625_07585 [Caldisericia bacterium]
MEEQTVEVFPNAGIELPLNPETLKLLRETSDKAQLSNHIGEQWDKRICYPTLSQLVTNPEQARIDFNLPANHEIGGVVALDANPIIKREAASLKIPDTVMLEIDPNDPSYVVLRACDFKFNLNMAQYNQVSPGTLSMLLVQSSSARKAIESAISELIEAGKLTGEFKVADRAIVDHSQTDFLPLDEARKIRGVTGRFISPDTEENHSYFMSGGKIRRENVFIRQLTPSEIDNLLADSPGQELASVVEQISNVTRSVLDRRLLLAKAQAAMKVKKIASLAKLKRFLEHPEEFPDPASQEQDFSQSTETKKTLGPILRGNLSKALEFLQQTIGQDKDARITALTVFLKTLDLPSETFQQVVDYCEANIK